MALLARWTRALVQSMEEQNTSKQFIPEVRALLDKYKYENSMVLQRSVDKIMADAANPFAGFDALMRFLCDEIAYLRTEVTLHRLLDNGSLSLTLPSMTGGDSFPDVRGNAPAAVTVWLGTAFDGKGWYAAEWLDTVKRAIRWSGPDAAASVSVFLNRDRQIRVEWDVISIFDSELVLEDLFIRVNGELLDTQCEVQEFNNKGMVWAILPKMADARSHFCEIEIVTPRVGSPQDTDPGSTDKRMLGIAASSMTAYPVTE